ncbi:hypothetical protein N658DRAFT_185855 [Parathielavia hyrcaniae]|uniref:Uncharacterized protein n=1 Tax=Parathielavia hyrcaniae TaxID=113614 RepID=A0AAN6T5C4_9PEZI|nr:hypothetical protein N658DRAFT_185855 [Parathielavia hyrcaniae]
MPHTARSRPAACLEMMLPWISTAHRDALQLRLMPLDFSQTTAIGLPGAGRSVAVVHARFDVDRAWMCCRCIPGHPKTAEVRTEPTGMRTGPGLRSKSSSRFIVSTRAAASLLSVLSQQMPHLEPFPSRPSPHCTVYRAFSGRPKHGCAPPSRSLVSSASSPCHPWLDQQRDGYIPEAPPLCLARGGTEVPSCPASNDLLAFGAAQPCIGAHGSSWILPFLRFPPGLRSHP